MSLKAVCSRFAYIVVFVAIIVPTTLRAAQSDTAMTFNGEIMDSLCAKAGSHDQMMDDMKSMGRDKSTCSSKCIQLGGKYVLYDSSKHAVYELDNQDKAEEFAGKKVRISGTLQKKTIKVTKIESIE